jgi:hypothetical protein
MAHQPTKKILRMKELKKEFMYQKSYMRSTFTISKIKMVFLVNICLIMACLELFSQQDKSKIAKKMLELTRQEQNS